MCKSARQILAEALGDRFAEVLRGWASEEEWAIMIEENGSGGVYAGGCCASHNFCDANEAMAEAFAKLGIKDAYHCEGEDGSPEHEAACELWNQAWSYAKAEHLGGIRRPL